MQMKPRVARWMFAGWLVAGLLPSAWAARTDADAAISRLQRQGRHEAALALAKAELARQGREAAAADARLVGELEGLLSLRQKAAENRLLLLQQQVTRTSQQTLLAWLLLALTALGWAGLAVAHRLGRQRRAAEEAMLARSRLLADASPDLRDPLHAVNLYLSILEREGLAPASRELVERARNCARSMADMLHWLLEQSLLGTSAPRAMLEDVALAALLERTRERFEPQARARGLVLTVRSTDAWVRSDPRLLQRMLDNLVANAVRYTVRGGVLVGCRRSGDGWRLVVYDSGPGIEPSYQEAIFSEGVRLAPASEPARALGLGLAIVKRLADELQVRVVLRSTPGSGSMFAIELPPASHTGSHVPAAEVAPPPQARHHPPALARPLEGRLLVVLDGHEQARTAMAAFLMLRGAQVVAPTRAEDLQACVRFCPRMPDLVISEYRLGHAVQATELPRLLHGLWRGPVPLLVVTAETAPRVAHALSSHGLPVLHKPVPGDMLVDVVERLLPRGAA